MDGNRGVAERSVCVCESGLCVSLIFPIARNEGGVATCFL